MEGIAAQRHFAADPSTKKTPVTTIAASAATESPQQALVAGFRRLQAMPVDVGKFFGPVTWLVHRHKSVRGAS